MCCLSRVSVQTEYLDYMPYRKAVNLLCILYKRHSLQQQSCTANRWECTRRWQLLSAASNVIGQHEKGIHMWVEDGQLRSWREIARELARETNAQKIVELSHKLNGAIAAQGMKVWHVMQRTSDDPRVFSWLLTLLSSQARFGSIWASARSCVSSSRQQQPS